MVKRLFALREKEKEDHVSSVLEIVSVGCLQISYYNNFL